MEITFVDTFNEGKYTLSVVKNFITYECEISEFESEHIEIGLLGEVIIEGTRTNPPRKIDENLVVKTTFSIDGETETKMHLELVLTYQKGKLKPKTETHKFVLSKKETDHTFIFQSMLKDFQTSLCLSNIAPGSSNVFVFISAMERTIFFVHQNRTKTYLVRKNIVIGDFFEFLQRADLKMRDFFQNRQNSQETVQKFMDQYLEINFYNLKMTEYVLNYVAQMFHVNFTRISNNGTRVIMNVQPGKQPKDLCFHVAEKLHNFTFDPATTYQIIQQFETEFVTQKVYAKIEIVSFKGKFKIYENGLVASEREIFCSNGLSLFANSDGHLTKIANQGAICKNQTIESPSEYLKISVNDRGAIESIALNMDEDQAIIPAVSYIFQTLQGSVETKTAFLIQVQK